MENNTSGFYEAPDISINVSTLVMCSIGNVFIVLLSCYGNGKILFTCCRTLKVHNNFKWLKTNLSTADFILSLTQCPILIFLTFGMPVLANILLPLALFCAGLCLTVSLNSISGIAIHRFLKLKWNYEIQKKFTSIFIAYSWISGILMASTFATLMSLKVDDLTINLSDSAVERKQFQTIAYVLVTLFLITLSLVLFVYTSIAKSLVPGPNPNPCLAKCKNKVATPQECDNTQLSNSIANKQKAILSCIGIMCAHVICWLPFTIVFTSEQYIKNCNVSLNIKVIVWMLVLLQSAVNPYIYQVPKCTYPRRFYCEQCLNFPDCKFHHKWPIRAEQRTRTCEISENCPSARAASGIFQISSRKQ